MGLGKPIEGNFDGGQISSDGGLLLLRMADQRLDLSESVKFCFPENRRPDRIKHTLESLLRQRIYAIAAGYEDCNDAAMLRFDPMHRLALGLAPADVLPLASQPTLSRFENSVDEVCLNLLQRSLVHIYIKQQRRSQR
ncbi:MAG: transposase [Candidatus Melainabacteria bacterium]|nr:transposase [Candidatus Melainabacteria bacterium]